MKTDRDFLSMARELSELSTCLRRRYGAVIVKDGNMVSTGWNDVPRGNKSCLETGICTRQQLGIKQGERYELCNSIHAEQNAILSANRDDLRDAALYLYGYDVEKDKEIEDARPCSICSKFIKQVGIARVVNLKYTNIFDDMFESYFE